jgi:T5SS/PEP-CTERM-associated repeat protein
LRINSDSEVASSVSYIGELANSFGEVSLLGENAVWNVTSTLSVGRAGEGELYILEGAQVNSPGAFVGQQAGSKGSVFVNVGLWELTTGALNVGTAGTGLVRIDIATISSHGGTIGGFDGEVRMDTGGWSNTASLNVTAGGNLLADNVSSVFSTYGVISGTNADVTLKRNSIWTNSGTNAGTGVSLLVGDSGPGKLTIENSTVTNATGMMGFSSSATAEVVIDGSTALWENTGRLTVGAGGDANLTIRNGGKLKSATAIVADDASSQSRVIIDGTGSKWEVTGTMAGAALQVGDTNGPGTEGTLIVRRGGQASVIAGQSLGVLGKGVLGGDGTIVGNVVSSATVDPGFVDELTGNNVLGTLQIQGNYRQVSGQLKIELDVAANDKLQATGNIEFVPFFTPCILDVELAPGFYPGSGHEFTILGWGGTLTGTASLQLPTLAPGLSWDSSRLYTQGILAVAGTTNLPGDFSNNGIVDAADWVLWAANPNHTLAQLEQWRANFGNSLYGAGTGQAAAPEPGSITLLLLGVGLLLLNRRRIVSLYPTSIAQQNLACALSGRFLATANCGFC